MSDLSRIADALERIADNLEGKNKPTVINITGKVKPADIEAIRAQIGRLHPAI